MDVYNEYSTRLFRCCFVLLNYGLLNLPSMYLCSAGLNSHQKWTGGRNDVHNIATSISYMYIIISVSFEQILRRYTRIYSWKMNNSFENFDQNRRRLVRMDFAWLQIISLVLSQGDVLCWQWRRQHSDTCNSDKLNPENCRLRMRSFII